MAAYKFPPDSKWGPHFIRCEKDRLLRLSKKNDILENSSNQKSIKNINNKNKNKNKKKKRKKLKISRKQLAAKAARKSAPSLGGEPKKKMSGPQRSRHEEPPGDNIK